MIRALLLLTLLYFPVLLLAQFPTFAQLHLQLKAGWTSSTIQVQSPEIFTPRQLHYQSKNFSPLHHPAFGLDVEIDYRRLFLATGLSYVAFGANSTPMEKQAWRNHYLVLPLIVGHQSFLSKSTRLLVEGSAEIGFHFMDNQQYGYGGAAWGSVQVVAGLQIRWKRFCLGTRCQVGVTKFRQIQGTTLRHAGWTTWLGYVLGCDKKELLELR